MKLSHLLIATLLSSGIATAQSNSKMTKPSNTSNIKKAPDDNAKPKIEKKQKQKQQLCIKGISVDTTNYHPRFSCPACGRG